MIRLTIRSTVTVTPDIGQFDDPTRPVRYPARALAKNANAMVMAAIKREIPIMLESQI